MTCPSDEILTRFGLDQSSQRERETVDAHLRDCRCCREAVAQIREACRSISEAHSLFDRGHVDGRAKLLASLEAEPAPWGRRMIVRIPHWIGESAMRRRIAFGSAGLVAAAAIFVLAFWLARPSTLLAEVAARVQEVETYSCRATMTAPGAPYEGLKKFYWKAPGSMRVETFQDDRLVETEIHPAGKAGIRIYHTQQMYVLTPPQNLGPGGWWSPGHWIAQLAGYSGKPDRDLGIEDIAGRRTHGFEVAVSKLEPDLLLPGVMRIWADVESRLPIRFETEMRLSRGTGTVRFDEFQWDAPLSDDLFQVAPPEGFADRTPSAKTDQEKEEHLVQALRGYADVAGHYPKVKILHGDLIYDMRAKAGIPEDPDQLTTEQIQSKAYVDLLKAPAGWLVGHEILRDNPDAAYYGRTVGPKDTDKVLFRWKLDDGRYRVLYGDLRLETVTAERLRELESTSPREAEEQ